MSIKQIVNDVVKEIERITNQAHKDYYKNEIDTWLRIIGEEYGEICRAVTDHEGKNFYTECVQTIAAIILMMKKKSLEK